ncbi:hypothetical protein [Cupriavidus sp. WS]|uniref:hypothetical protein n=1 Tax=Cupriavidus sp. WS TaxID=1312922 RepID=UPI0012DC54BB|nr:hypothetical protein [Cupriavidus sp. WS]
MSRDIFRPGGPLDVRNTGIDTYTASVTLPTDGEGRSARECPNTGCSPGYFKVKPGTGLTREPSMFCPYCRTEAKPDEFHTQEQVRYAQDLVMNEVRVGFDDLLRDALGLGAGGKRKFGGGFVSMEMSLKSEPLPPVLPPLEEEVRRDVVCPHCTLDQTVFGLATWCSDCGQDIFLTHIEGELNVVGCMVGDIGRREQELGRRVAAKDLENCLEDAVSIFEAAMKAMTRRFLEGKGSDSQAVEEYFVKQGNAFQNVGRTKKILAELVGSAPADNVPWDELNAAFEKRHPITHNLGVVDRQYISRAKSGDRHGREVRVTVDEIKDVLGHVLRTLSLVHRAMWPLEPDSTPSKEIAP